MSKAQIRTRIVHQATEIVTGFLTTKNSLYLTGLSVLTVLAPFLHLLASPSSSGYFGFSFMSSFLNALGLPISLISVSLLLMFLSRQIQNEYSSPFKLISILVLAVGCIYLLYVFIPMKDFSTLFYYTMIAVLGSALAFIVIKIHKAVMVVEEEFKGYLVTKMKGHIRYLISFIWSKAKSKEIDEIEVFNVLEVIADEYE